MQQNEPEDHFGSLLLLTARLAENERHTECEQLLARHLFPWSSRFLDVFIEKLITRFTVRWGAGPSDAGAMAVAVTDPDSR